MAPVRGRVTRRIITANSSVNECVYRSADLAAVGGARLAALVGCQQPEPTVVDATANSELFGPTTIDVEVVNGGPSGAGEEITVYSSDDIVLSKHRRTVRMAKGERREVTFKLDLKAEAERFSTTAKPAGYF